MLKLIGQTRHLKINKDITIYCMRNAQHHLLVRKTSLLADTYNERMTLQLQKNILFKHSCWQGAATIVCFIHPHHQVIRLSTPCTSQEDLQDSKPWDNFLGSNHAYTHLSVTIVLLYYIMWCKCWIFGPKFHLGGPGTTRAHPYR